MMFGVFSQIIKSVITKDQNEAKICIKYDQNINFKRSCNNDNKQFGTYPIDMDMNMPVRPVNKLLLIVPFSQYCYPINQS